MREEFNSETPTEGAEAHFEEAVRSISYLGYECIENFNFMVPIYEDRPDDLKALLKKHNLEFVNLYHTYHWDGTDETLQKWLDKGERTCRFLQEMGAKYLNMQGYTWHDAPYYRPDNKELLDIHVDAFTKMGAIAKKYGVQACLHPHGGTPMFSESSIDYFFSKADNDLVKLTLDTAHTTLGGMDPVYAIEKYRDLLVYVHLKDLDPDETNIKTRPNDRFCSLGQGFIDFRNVILALRRIGYDGVLCVENDNPRICNYQSAEFSREYIKSVLGM
ncbi:MAG: sugar phosphate isomerase/epimerase [Oscillospiraceae bacterium]|nr:sugar phosphate isomerase/epimerase [Oscillospiraceae bacterium]